ncbi:hypothetical protein BDV12DRAFT_191678 [Aspergillus spectabilis]
MATNDRYYAIVTLSRVLSAYELDRYSLNIGKIRPSMARSYRKSTHQNTGYEQTMTTKETFGFPMYTKDAVQSKRHERSNMKLPNPGSTAPLNP